MEKRSYYMSKMPLLRPSMLTFVLASVLHYASADLPPHRLYGSNACLELLKIVYVCSPLHVTRRRLSIPQQSFTGLSAQQ